MYSTALFFLSFLGFVGMTWFSLATLFGFFEGGRGGGSGALSDLYPRLLTGTSHLINFIDLIPPCHLSRIWSGMDWTGRDSLLSQPNCGSHGELEVDDQQDVGEE